MSDELDLFVQMNHALLDLQRADYQTWERPLKRLAGLVRHADLQSFNERLTAGLDLDAFLEKSANTGGSMVGSHRLAWPNDEREVLGLIILLLDKMASDTRYALDLSHTYFYSGSKIISGIRSMTSNMLIPFVRDYRAYVLSSGEAKARLIIPASNKVFIVHGHDDAALQGLARFIEKLGLVAIVLMEQPNQGRTIIQKFEDCSEEVGYAVVLMTPDDTGGSARQSAQTARARQNVIYELGYFGGKLGRGRVCLLRKGDVEIPSDLYGVLYTDMDAAGAWKVQLVRELKAAGLDFDANRAWDA